MAVNSSTGFCAAILGPQAFDSIFRDGAIEIWSGAQPATADDGPVGTLLARITRNGGAWQAGSPSNGLRFVRDGRFVFKDPAQSWVLRGVGVGIAGWFRLVANAPDGRALSVTVPRIDGAVGLDDDSPGDFQMRLPTLSITPDTSIELGDWWYAIPPI